MMVTAQMPQDVPACGRIGCEAPGAHSHFDWQPGDRIVAEPKLTTAPGWVWRCPRGAIVEGQHARGAFDVVTVSLDDGERHEVDHRLLTRERTYDRRGQQRTTPAEKPRKGALDPLKYDEPTLDDWMAEEIARRRRP